jgi:hypothetical protein
MEIMLKHFSIKFNTLRNLLDKLKELNIESGEVDTLITSLNDIEIRFVLTTSPIQLQLIDPNCNKSDITGEFNMIIFNENFSIDINNIFYLCIDFLYKNGINVRVSESLKKFNIKDKKKKNISCLPIYLEIQNIIDIFPINIDYNIYNQYVNYRACEICGNDMEIDAVKSELICHGCSMIKPLIGVSFENIQFHMHELQKTKSGTFNPNRHFHFWWSHILAKEDEYEVNNELFAKLHKIIKRDKKILRMLTIIDVRNMLKEIKKSDLNKNIPLILKKLTGISPPNIPEEIEIKVENIFTKVIETCEDIKRGGRINRNYYPYYIYKIIDSIIPEEDFENRRILYYIYIQSKETVEGDDVDWEQICNFIPELTYKPTDRTEYLKYQPN